jgi:transposase
MWHIAAVFLWVIRSGESLKEEIYKERNLVERLFQKLKNFRRIATQYERLARNYQAMLNLLETVIWLN